MLNYLFYVIGVTVSCLGGIFFTTRYYKKRIFVLSDVLKLSQKTRNWEQLERDAVLQLQNEIAESGALEITEQNDGSYLVELNVFI